MIMDMKEKKLVVVDTYGTLTELGGISGPIISPSYIDLQTLLTMINNHRKVYEVNPTNRADRVRLNITNLRTENFPKANVKTKANVAPEVKVEEPVEETSVPVKTKNAKKDDKLESDFTKK